MLRKILALCLIWAVLLVLPGALPALCAEADNDEPVSGIGQTNLDLAEWHLQEGALSEHLAELEQASGREAPDLIPVLSALAALQAEKWQHEEAEALLRRALAICEKTGPDSPCLGNVLNDLAVIHDRQGEFERAEPLYLRALEIWERTVPEDDPNVLTTLSNLAGIYTQMERYEEALPYRQRELALQKKVSGRENLRTTQTLLDLAKLHARRGKLDEAERLLLRARDIVEKRLDPDHLVMAAILSRLANLYDERGEHGKAESLLLRALAIVEEAAEPGNAFLADARYALAAHYRARSRHEQADEFARRTHRDMNAVCSTVDATFGKRGDHENAAVMACRLSLFFEEKAVGLKSPDVAMNLNYLAVVHNRIGQYGKAEALLRKSLAIQKDVLGPYHPEMAEVLTNLAAVCGERQRYDEGERLARQALEMLEKTLGPNHPDLAAPLNVLAVTYARCGQRDKAEPFYQRALALREKASADNPLAPVDPIVLVNTAGNFIIQGRHAEAAPLLRQALVILLFARPSERGERVWMALNTLAFFYDSQSHVDPAIFYLKLAVNALQETRESNADLATAAQRGFLRRNEAFYTALADLLLARNRLAEAQQALAMLKVAEYREFIGEDAGGDPRRSWIAFTPKEAEWERRFRELAGKRASKQEVDAFLEDIDAAFSPDELDESNRLDNTSPMQGVLGTLGPRTALVQYLMPLDRVWILVTTADGMVARQVDVGAEELNQKVEAFREAVVTRNPETNTLGRELFDLLIAPASEDLKTARTLMLAPDGALRYLPFAALYDGEKYLVERYTLANFTDMTKDRITDKPVADWNFAGFGVSRAVGGHSPLPAVKEELNGIRDNAIPGEIRLDEQFTGETFKAGLAQSPPVVHVATHFVFEKGDEQASYLQLGDGGRLTLRELRGGYRFEGVDLVALSACDTAVGGGEEKDGREVEGLGVLVQRQGAKGVLASLWPVNDESTGQLMRLFYGYRRQEGLSKAAALRKAQLAFIEGRVDAALKDVDRNRGRVPAGAPVAARPARSTDPAHPYFWAPFILMGNWL